MPISWLRRWSGANRRRVVIPHILVDTCLLLVPVLVDTCLPRGSHGQTSPVARPCGRRRLRRDRALPPRARHRLRAGRRERRHGGRWAARQSPIPAAAVRWLAGLLFLGGIGPVISVAWYGWPHGFQVALAVVELTVPLVYFWLAPADERG